MVGVPRVVYPGVYIGWCIAQYASLLPGYSPVCHPTTYPGIHTLYHPGYTPSSTIPGYTSSNVEQTATCSGEEPWAQHGGNPWVRGLCASLRFNPVRVRRRLCAELLALSLSKWIKIG